MSIPAGTLACPAATECIEVGTEMSAGNPLSGAHWTTEHLDDESKGFSAVSCVSPHQCVAVDEDGLVTVGTNAAPPPAPTRVDAVIVSKHVHHDAAAVTIDCYGRPTSACALALTLEAIGRPHSARHTLRAAHQRVVVDGDQQAVVQISLDAAGRVLLATRHALAVRLTSTEHGIVRHWGTLAFKQRSQNVRRGARRSLASDWRQADSGSWRPNPLSGGNLRITLALQVQLDVIWENTRSNYVSNGKLA
jgi:hypothetical protein